MSGRLFARMRGRAPIAAACAVVGVAACATGGPAVGHDLDGLAAALAARAGGARVDPSDLRWEPSRGAVLDLLLGRHVLFLARAPGEDTRDVWRGRVRVAPDGGVVDVADARNLTNTPLGDEHALVVRGAYAAYATRAYAREQGVTVLSLAGEGERNRAARWPDRVMAAITNLQRTGTPEGVGRLDVTFESPGRAVALELGDDALDLTLFDGDARRGTTSTRARVALATGELGVGPAGIHTEPVIHLPKRFSHWTVDTLRAVSFIGPAPIAWAEDQALAARDTFRRVTFSSGGSETDVVATAPPPPAVLDTSEASQEEAHWPPPRIPTMWKSAEPGEGEWVPPTVPWVRKPADLGAVASDAPSPFYQTFVRPDPERPYARVLLVAMDMRQLDLDMEAGVEDPEPLTGPPGAGRIPRTPAVYRRVAAAFNGAFKTEHGHYGMMVHKRVLLPPVSNAATVVVLDDTRVAFGTWGDGRRVGGIAGVADDAIASFRQNLDPLVDHGSVNPTGRNLWGFTLPGKGAQTERTGLCVTTAGHVIYAWGDDLSGTTLAKALAMAGCDYALHLDMNPYHTGFLFTAIDDLAARKYKSALLSASMSIPVDRYIQYAPKDFFYVLVHDPAPPAVPGASAWAPDGGRQPPPHWIAGIWTAHGQAEEPRDLELLDVEPGRATWRVRAGTQDAIAASPSRRIASDEGRRVLLAAGLGVSPERRPLGLATDGRIAVAPREGRGLGAIVVSADGALSIVRMEEAPVVEAGQDLVEVPVVLWDGERPSETPGPLTRRSALGVTPSGRVVFARATTKTAGPLVDALVAAGCTRAVSLDRGVGATGFIDRAGTDRPPRAQYDESVLYALGTPLRPRAFRFDATTMVAQATKK